MILLEIGGHDGLFQANTSTKDDKDHQVILVEANPSSYKKCVNNRPNATCVHAACTDQDGGIIKLNLGQGSSYSFLDFMGEISQKSNKVDVPRRTMASILKELNIDTLDKMWLDVEGCEYYILKGMEPNTVKWIEIEFHSTTSSNWTPKVGRSTFEQIDSECKRLGLSETSRGETYGNNQFKAIYELN